MAQHKFPLADSIEFDGGQRDNFYSPITIKRDGISGTILTIYVKMDNFEWNSGGEFFSVNSYTPVAPVDSTNTQPKFSYSDIPSLHFWSQRRSVRFKKSV